MDKLTNIREKIDIVDKEIYQLIKKRAELAHSIGEIKRQNNSDDFYRPEREAQVLRFAKQNNDSLLRDEDIAYIFRQIMSACLALEMPMNISYLGPIGTWTFDAAIKHFGSGVTTVPAISIENVFNEVLKGNAKYGVVPIENSSNGTVTLTVNNLFKYNLKICGEVELKINHQLLAKNNNIKTIVAHQQALSQCHNFLVEHYPDVELKEVVSNAMAAKMASTDDSIAAIASVNAAAIYKLDVIDSNIEDNSDNSTRFLILGKENILPSGDDKTTFLISAKDKSGMLFDILSPFRKHNINLLKLNSYPDPNLNNWQYLFLIDIEGHIQDENIQNAIKELENIAINVKILGSYPKSVL